MDGWVWEQGQSWVEEEAKSTSMDHRALRWSLRDLPCPTQLCGTCLLRRPGWAILLTCPKQLKEQDYGNTWASIGQSYLYDALGCLVPGRSENRTRYVDPAQTPDWTAGLEDIGPEGYK